MIVASVFLALACAVLLALGSTIEQDSAQRQPQTETLKLPFLTKLARDPRWLVGMALATLSFPLQATALGLGGLVVVEPIIAAGIALAVPMQWVLWRRAIRPLDIALAGVVAAALATFLVSGDLAPGKRDAEPLEWAIAGGAAGSVALVFAAIGRSKRGPVRAGMLGVAAGALFGVQSALIKATVGELSNGVLTIFADWHLYALIITGITAMVLEQSAYQAGALAPSVAATKLMAAVSAVAMGLLVFDERIAAGGARQLIAVTALALAFVALIALSMAKEIEDEAEAQPPLGRAPGKEKAGLG